MGQYESNSFDLPLLFLCTPVNTTSYAETVEMWLIPRLRQRSHGNCVAAAWWSTCTFCPHCVWHSELTSFKPLEWLWFTNISHKDLTMADNSVWGIKKGTSSCASFSWQDVKGCGRGICCHYDIHDLKHVAESVATYVVVFWTQWCAHTADPLDVLWLTIWWVK